MIYLIISATILALLLWPYHTLITNYNTARKLNLPVLITRIGARSRIHGVLGNLGGHTSNILRQVPFGLFSFLNYTGFEFLWSNGLALHAKHGPAYVVVSPGEVNLVISGPSAVKDILIRRKEFGKGQMNLLDMFGENVFTLNGKDWERHRRLTTAPFTEKISRSVWNESTLQARSMLHTWTSKGESGVKTTATDTMTLVLHVLSSTAFGRSYAFEAGVQKIPTGHTISYLDSLRLIFGNPSAAVIVANVPFPQFLLPSLRVEVKHAVSEYGKYMTEILHEERALDSADGRDNLLSAFSRASGAEKERRC